MPQTDQQSRRDWRGAIGSVASAIQSGRLRPGDLAELRRTGPGRTPDSSAFWHVLVRLVEPFSAPPEGERMRSAWEQRWATVLSGMARLHHDTRRSLGRVLAESGLHELRFRRLMRATGDRLADELAATVRYLAAKGEAINWIEAAELIFSAPEGTPEWGEKVRHRIARDYFTTQMRQEGTR